MLVRKLALAVVIAIIIALYFVAGGEKYLSIRLYQDLFEQSPIATASVFFIVFLVGTSCSLPVAGVLSVVSGVVFGALPGFFISLLAVTLGGTVALYSTRYLFYALVKRRFTGQIEVVNKGIEKEGAFFLFSLRMIPIIPFWLLNLLMGLTSMRASVFMLATLSGMVPVVLILAYTGSQLGHIESFSVAGIFSPGVVLALGLLAIFPLLARALIRIAQRYAKKAKNEAGPVNRP